MVTISIPINGTSLSSDEYLLDADGNVMRFNTVKEAKQFLLKHGIKEIALGLIDYHVER